MHTFKMTMMALVVAAVTYAAPDGKQARTDHAEMAGKRARMMYVVAIADELELSEAEALKLSERLKGLEERRQPVRQQMHEAMQAVKAAADGDAAALAQVDANIQKVLDGRAQMAVMDKELVATLGKDLTPQKRAKLALVLAKLNGRDLKKGRRFHR